MSGPILIYLPDELLERLNKRVEAGKVIVAKRKLTKIEREQANQLAAKKGEAAAQKFIDSLHRPDKRRSSRVKLIAELIDIGLKHSK